MKKTVLTILSLFALAAASAAQTPGSGAREAVASLPESQGVLVVNARRITNEALPRVIPPAEIEKFVAEVRKSVNVDLRAVEFVALGVRLRDGSTAVFPDMGLVVRGGFNADALLTFVRMAQAGQYRPETHGGKTIDIFKINFEGDKPPADGAAQPQPDASQPQSSPMKLPNEIALVSLGADELLVGTPDYVRSAIDARAGAGARIRADLAELALRDTAALVSVAAELPPGLSKYLGTADAATGGAMSAVMNDEIKRLVDAIRQVQASVNMTPAQFGVQTTVRTDRPEDARALSGLVAFGVNLAEQELQKGVAAAKTQKARADATQLLGLVRALSNTTSGNDMTLSLSVAQTTVANFVKQMTAKPAAAPARKAPARRAPARRARRRAA
jgi:hypothetical protein